MNTTQIMETLTVAISLAAYPKIIPVVIENDWGMTLWAAYHLDQGKRTGRKTDFTGCYRLGGLFIEATVKPESGLITAIESFEQFDLANFSGQLDTLVWGKNAIQQVMVTDGERWTAFVRGRDGRFFAREDFSTPCAPIDAQDPAAIGRHVWELSLLHEKLKRSLLPWKDIDDPAVLAMLAVSYATSLFLSMEFADSSLPDDFIESLENELSVFVHGQNQRDTAIQLLASITVLEQIATAVSRGANLSLALGLPDSLVGCVERVQSRKNEFPVDPFGIIGERLVKDPSPSRIAEFCKVFWNGLPNGGVVWDAVSSLSDEIADSHIDFFQDRLAAELPLFEDFGDKRISWLDPHAGTGNLFIRALYGGKNGPGIQGAATVIESSPLKFYLLRLRVIVALFDLARTDGRLPSVRLMLANPLTEPKMLKVIPESPLCVLGSDLRIIEEKRIHNAGNPELAERHKVILGDTWGMSAFDEQDGFAQYAALMDDFLQSRKHAAALLFTPNAWLDDDVFAAARMAWGKDGDKMYVTVLPEDFSHVKRVRKTGLVSAVVLRLFGGDALAAYGRAIRYNEDIATDMATDEGYQPLQPTRENRFSLSPIATSRGYSDWPSLLELTLTPPIGGPAERRGMALIDMDRDKLAERMREYFSDMSDKVLARNYPSLMPTKKRKSAGAKGFDASKVRGDLLRHFQFDESRIVPYPSRPFDYLWAYLENLRPLFKEPSPELQELREIPGNAFLVVREPNERAACGVAAWFSPHLCDYDFFAGNSRHFPLYVDASVMEGVTSKRRRGGKKLLVNPLPVPNLSSLALTYLDGATPAIRKYEENVQTKMAELGEVAKDIPARPENLNEVLWHHILAVLFTPAYNKENGEALRKDWPRIPMPCWSDPESLHYDTSTLRLFSQTGRRIAELFSMRPVDDTDWPGLTSVAALFCGTNRVHDSSSLTLADNWAIRTKVNAVRPGKGKTKPRPYSTKEADELTALLTWSGVVGAEMDQAFGGKTVDVSLNDGVRWCGVPEKTWEFELGGHKVLRKWLSYRTGTIINRPLTLHECEVFSDIARRITLLIALGQRLDYLWPRLKTEAGQ